MKDSNELLELDSVPKPLEPLTPKVADSNLELMEDDITARVERLKARLTRWQRWTMRRRVVKLWKILNRNRYNAVVSERFELYQKLEDIKQQYTAAKADGATAAYLTLLSDSGRAIAAAGRAVNQRLKMLAPIHDEYESIQNKLAAHEDAIQRDKEEAENRAAFYQEKTTYENLLRAALYRMPKVHHIGRDSKGNEYINIPEFEEVFISEDRMWFKILTSSQSWFQRMRGNKWSSRLPYGVLPDALTSDETLHALSVATDRSVTVERGQRGQSLYWVVNRLDSPDGIPTKVGYNKVIQYYPTDRHHMTPWPMGVTKNRKAEWLTLEEYPNVLIAGAAGGGKSNELNAIIATLVTMNRPDELRIILIDNKGGVEFTHWREVKHLIGDMIKSESEVLEALQRVIGIVKHRLVLFEKMKAKKLSAFNAKVKDGDKLPRVVLIVDELSTLTGLDESADIQQALRIITAQGRAVGIHVILCTQHVSVNVIEGAIKTNMQVRASTKMPSEVSSRIILDTMAAALLPNIPGRMVFSLGRSETVAQAPLITDGEIATAVEVSKGYPAGDDTEFNGGAPAAQDKFTRDDLIALTISDFNGRLAASVIHEALGNEVITLRKLRELVQSVINEGRFLTWEGKRYEMKKDRNVHVLHPIQQSTEQKSALIQ